MSSPASRSRMAWLISASLVLLTGMSGWLLSPLLFPGYGLYLPGREHRMLCVFYGKSSNARLALASRFREMDPGLTVDDLFRYLMHADPRIRWSAGWIIDKTEYDPRAELLQKRIQEVDSDPDVGELDDRYHAGN